MKRLLLLLVLAACAGSTEEETGAEAVNSEQQAELRAKYRREIRLCAAFAVEQRPNCLMALAAEKREPFLCSEIPETSSWKSECYGKVAALTGQSVLCLRIGPPSIQAQCYAAAAAVNRDPSSCKPVLAADTKRKEKERSIPAIELGSTDWTVDANYKACVAVAKGDRAGCEAINPVTDSESRRLCFQQLAFSTGDSSLCAQLQTEGSSIFVHGCLKEVGIKTARKAVCEQIPAKGDNIAFRYRNECIRSIDLFTKTGVKCEERDPLCSGRIAAATGDLTVCRKLRSYTEIDNCLIAYAHRTADRTICGEMRNTDGRSICQELAGTGSQRTPVPATEVAKTQSTGPDGRAEARSVAETAARRKEEAVRFWSRAVLDDLERIERRSEERMRLGLMKSQASESSPRATLMRIRSAELVLKMRWCSEGDVAECIELAEDLFRNCQFNKSDEVLLTARRHLDSIPQALDGHLIEADVRQNVERGISRSDPSRRSEVCATYALSCCTSDDTQEAALWEWLWNDYRRNANVAISGLPIEDDIERLMLAAVRGSLLRKQHDSIRGLEYLDVDAARPAREVFIATAKRFCSAAGSSSCRVLTESYLEECRFREAQAAYRAMIKARAAEAAVLERVHGYPEAREILQKELANVPGGLPDPATFSEERRALCERLKGGRQ